MSLGSTLFAGEKVYGHADMHELRGDGVKVFVGGEYRYLSRQPPPPNAAPLGFADFEDVFPLIPRSEWDARIDEQIAKKSRVSDFQDFEPYDQNGTNFCWINGGCQAFTTMRRIMGLPLVVISSASCGGPITGYKNVGGWEGEGMKYLAEHGGVDVKLWPNNAINRSYADKPEVIENRKHHIAVDWLDIGHSFDRWGTLALMCLPGAFAKNAMSHVMQACDLVRTEKGSYGLRFRNSWGKYGVANDLGFFGYGTFREGNHYDSGCGLRQVTASIT